MLNRTEAPSTMQRLRKAGFLSVSAETLPALLRQHPRVLVLLQSDPLKHPEVADSWVIVPELIAQFPPGTVTPAVADLAESDALARQYRVLKFPTVLFFHHQRLTGSISGLLPWQEYVDNARRYLTDEQAANSIPVVQNLS